MATEWLDEERELPLPRQKKGIDHTQTEPVRGYFGVKDMFAFENVGFTRSAAGQRVSRICQNFVKQVIFSSWCAVNASRVQSAM